MQDAADATKNSFSNAIDDITNKISPNSMSSPEAIGDAAIQMAKGAKDRFVKSSKIVFDKMSQRIGNAPASLDNVKNWVGKATSEVSDPILKSKFENSIKKELGGVYDDITLPDGTTIPRPLTFYDLKHLRTRIGERLENPLIADTDTVGRGVLKKTYEAITKDMEASATNAGQGELFNKVNKWYDTQKDIHGTLEKLVGSGEAKAVGEKLLSPNISSKTVNAMRRKFSTEEWDTLAGTMFQKMARAKPGKQNILGTENSADTFLTNWYNMRDVRKAIWGGTRYKEVSGEIDKLATVAEALKKSSALNNSSHTSGVSWWMNFIRSISPVAMAGAAMSGNMEAAVGMASLGYGANRFAKLITNPDFVRWAANSGQMALKKELPETLKHQMIRRLLVVGKKNPDITEDVNGFIQDFATGYLTPPL
jgi:hypothetical protein